MSRNSVVKRETQETRIHLALDIDPKNPLISVDTGFGMLDHLLSLTAFWAGFSLALTCEGDLRVDAHHTTEDVGMCFGQALFEALGDRKGIARVGYGRVPMDEALAEVTIDISGRPWSEWRGAEYLPPVIAGEESDVWRELYKAIASSARMNLHVCFDYGKNGHHLLESAAKGFGLALAQAVALFGTTVRSTKGSLD